MQDLFDLAVPELHDAEQEILRRVEIAELLSAAHAPRRPFPAEAYRSVIAVARRLRGASLEAAG
jgi:hypothetical protein